MTNKIEKMTDDDFKKIMQSLGMPDSMSLYAALKQVENHTWQAAKSVPVMGEPVTQKTKQSVDFTLPLTLGVEQGNEDFAVLATFNNQSGAVPNNAFQSLVKKFMDGLYEAGVNRSILLVNREDAPATLDKSIILDSMSYLINAAMQERQP